MVTPTWTQIYSMYMHMYSGGNLAPLSLSGLRKEAFQSNRTEALHTLYISLTLIQPSEVKIDLANFDFKFRTKFLYVRFF
jgi:hypothetical protein